jgi:hypothetical protein
MDLLDEMYGDVKRWMMRGAKDRNTASRSCKSADEAFAFLLAHAMLSPSLGSPRNMEIVGESVGADISLAAPGNRRLVSSGARGVRVGYPAASIAWNLDMRNDVDSICWWNPNGKRISDDGETFFGANYGQRWRGYLDSAVELLREDSDTRRAWIPIWKPEDMFDDKQPPGSMRYSFFGKDVPCTIGFNLRLYDDLDGGKLGMQVIMRSQAAFGVFPYDLFLFSVLQELIANELDVGVGFYRHHCMSSHIYAREIEQAKRALEAWLNGSQSHSEPMAPIGKTLTEATDTWPSFMDAVMRGDTPEPTDPIEQMMLDGAKEIIDGDL